MNRISCKLIDPKCLPVKQTIGAAAYDLVARDEVIVEPGKIRKVPLGVCLALPSGTYAEIRPRSGLTMSGIIVQLGTIDADYRGELHAIVYNTDRLSPYGSDIFGFRVERYMRIAQLIIARAVVMDTDANGFDVVDELDVTARGAGGFGSTGLT